MSSAGSADPNGDAFTYLWNFGDGTATSTASAPSHTFPANSSYTVTLTLTDAWGDAANTTRVVSFTEPPTNVAPIPVIDAPACTARACTFSGVTSSDPNGDTFTYLWTFGDGPATNTAASPTHSYAIDGTYTVTLTLTDAWGKAASTTRVVTIAKPPTNVAPVPVINPVVCVARALHHLRCQLVRCRTVTPSPICGPSATALRPPTPSTVTHTYAVDGTYTAITLTRHRRVGRCGEHDDAGHHDRRAAAPTPLRSRRIGAPLMRRASVCAFSAVGIVRSERRYVHLPVELRRRTATSTVAGAARTRTRWQAPTPSPSRSPTRGAGSRARRRVVTLT